MLESKNEKEAERRELSGGLAATFEHIPEVRDCHAPLTRSR